MAKGRVLEYRDLELSIPAKDKGPGYTPQGRALAARAYLRHAIRGPAE